MSKITKEVEEIIRETAGAAASEVVRQQRAALSVNHYQDTERLLRNYKAMKRLYDHPEEYSFLPREHSATFTGMPPSGGSFKDRQDRIDEYIEERMRSDSRSCAQFARRDAVVEQFASKPEFVVIRMYYFDEDAYGNDRIDGERYTFERISEDLAAAGIQRSEKTLRMWRSQLVQDMTVCLFVIDGALSIGNRVRQKNDRPKEE